MHAGTYQTSPHSISLSLYLSISQIVTTQASYFSNAKHTIFSPFGGENSVFRGKY